MIKKGSEITFRERERQRDNLIFCKEDRNLCEVNERRIWNKILIYWLYKLCTPAYSQGSLRAGGFRCVSYWFCLNHFIVITQKGLWYFVCEVVNENWWRNFHWFYIFGLYMVYSFIRYQIFLSSKRRKAKIFQFSNLGEFFAHEYIWSRLDCCLQCLRSKWSLMCRQTMNLS